MRWGLVFIALAMLAGCGAQTPAPQAHIAAGGDYWQAETGGVVRHTFSGVGFPEQLGSYKRVKTIDFADDGSDVGLMYIDASQRMGNFQAELTLYVTHAPKGTPQAYLDQASQAIVDRFKTLDFIQEGTFTPESGGLPTGPYRLFAVELGGQKVRTGAWTARKGDWLLKARFTYPEKQDEMLALIANMLNAELAKSGAGTSVSVTSNNAEGIAPDMEHVGEALKQVRW